MRLIDADTLIKELEEEAKSLEKESFEIKENTVLKSNLMGRADGIRDALIEIIDVPTVEPLWDEILVICDNCGHAIHVKRGNET